MMKYKKYLFLIVIITCFQLDAQVKNEREYRIDLSAFPEKSQQTLKQIPEKAIRIRFYKETDNDKHSFESKFKFDGHWHSVEFDTKGQLEDIEIKVGKSKIDERILDAIESYLDQNFEKFEYVKIQKQFLQNSDATDSEFLLSVLNKAINSQPNWELILMVKIKKTYEIQEITFDDKGQFINSRKLVPTSYENIMY